MELFSQRQGIDIIDKEITVRNDAPEGLRGFIPILYYEFDKRPSDARAVICRVLHKVPDQSNWSEHPNIEYEVQDLMQECPWYRVYDIIEVLATKLSPQNYERFETEINVYFRENGIGWKLSEGKIESRGDKLFEEAVSDVAVVLKDRDLHVAKGEISEAIKDISRRPEPDITGAIQHSNAALECVCREITGDKTATLGTIISNHPDIIPAPLNEAIKKMWGYASQMGRHLQEGRMPNYEEAELMVHLSASMCSYLGKKHIEISPKDTSWF